MENRFMDVSYFVYEASNFTQKEFEYNYADVIHVFDTNKTHLTTEDERELIISWDDKGYFKSYFVNDETQLMENSYTRTMVRDIINKLRTIEVDGETMQYIIEKVGMTDQMLRQLILTNPYTDTTDLLEEKVRLSDDGIHL